MCGGCNGKKKKRERERERGKGRHSAWTHVAKSPMGMTGIKEPHPKHKPSTE